MSDRLAEIEAQLDAATTEGVTPPPWVVHEDHGEVWVTATDEVVYVCEAVDGSLAQRRAVAAMIAAAPTDLRDLVRLARVVGGLVVVSHSGHYCDQCRTAVDECRCPIGVLRAALANLEREPR